MRFHKLGKCVVVSTTTLAALVFAIWAWPQSDIPVRVVPVGGITVVVDSLSLSDVAEIKKVAHQQMWRSNMSDLRLGGIRALPTVVRRFLLERMRAIEVEPNGCAKVLTRSGRRWFKTTQLPRYSSCARRFTVQRGTNGWQVVRVELDQLKEDEG